MSEKIISEKSVHSVFIFSGYGDSIDKKFIHSIKDNLEKELEKTANTNNSFIFLDETRPNELFFETENTVILYLLSEVYVRDIEKKIKTGESSNNLSDIEKGLELAESGKATLISIIVNASHEDEKDSLKEISTLTSLISSSEVHSASGKKVSSTLESLSKYVEIKCDQDLLDETVSDVVKLLVSKSGLKKNDISETSEIERLIDLLKKSIARNLSWRSSKWFILLVVTVGLFADAVVYAIALPIIPIIVERNGGGSSITGVLVSLFAVGCIGATPMAGWMASMKDPFAKKLPDGSKPKFGKRNAMLVALLLMLGCNVLSLIGLLPGLAGFITMGIARVLMGASSTIVWVLGLSLLAEAYKVDDGQKSDVGKAMSIAYAGNTAAKVISPPL
ncbi:hypothetical protein HK096_009040, partial [Nowakowskiella sp. JEL0078]